VIETCICGELEFNFDITDSGVEMGCPFCNREYQVFVEEDDSGFIEASLEEVLS